MNVTFEKTGDARGQITVQISENDYADKVTEKLKSIGKTHVIPGFRKGHISVPELRKRFGHEVKSEVINDVVINATFDHIKEKDIQVIGQPLPAETKTIDLKQTEYTFKYDIALWPQVDIQLNKDVKLPFYNIEVSQEMLDEQDKAMCERFGAQVPGDEVDAKAVVKGSLMELNADGSVKTDEGAIQVVSSIVAPFLFKGQDEAAKFLGKHVNDKVVFNPFKAADGNAAELASMLNIDKDKAADVKADFEFAISEIIVLKLAEHNQDYYDDVFGKDKTHSEEEYFDGLKNMIKAQLYPNSLQMSNRDIHDYIMATYADKVVIDDELLKRWMKLNDKELTDEKLEAEYGNMLPGIKWELLSGSIARQLEVKVTDEDMKQHANMVARRQLQQYGMYNMDDETVADMGRRLLADKSIARQLAEQIEEFKLFQAVRDAVTLEEKNVSLDEFKALAEKTAE